MTEQLSSDRQITKAISLFGGVQFFNIIISVIRGKIVAVLLGPAGVGIMGLLNATTGMIAAMTNFGLGVSAVKDISSANGKDNQEHVSVIVTVVRRLVWLTGMLGFILTAILSPWLSLITFGNKDYTLAFLWISITLLFNQISSGQLVLLQGLRKYNFLAKANLAGSFIGLFVTLPFYYFWGLDGIVPGIIGTSLISLLISFYFSNKLKINRVHLSNDQLIAEGKSMLTMGFMISLSGLLTVGVEYVVRIFISNKGGIEQVGLYNAGFAIINTYVGLIFNAMATDYYPRLSAIAGDNKLCTYTINKQNEIALLILSPLIVFFLVFINWIVILLYSRQFIGAIEMIQWAIIGIFFKATSWSIAFIFLAKGESKAFFFIELVSTLLFLCFSLIGYNFGGLSGVGKAFTVYYLFYLILVFWIGKVRYDFLFNKSSIQIFTIQFILATIAFISVLELHKPLKYVVSCTILFISTLYSIVLLNKKIGIVDLIKKKIQNN